MAVHQGDRQDRQHPPSVIVPGHTRLPRQLCISTTAGPIDARLDPTRRARTGDLVLRRRPRVSRAPRPNLHVRGGGGTYPAQFTPRLGPAARPDRVRSRRYFAHTQRARREVHSQLHGAMGPALVTSKCKYAPNRLYKCIVFLQVALHSTREDS